MKKHFFDFFLYLLVAILFLKPSIFKKINIFEMNPVLFTFLIVAVISFIDYLINKENSKIKNINSARWPYLVALLGIMIFLYIYVFS